MTEYIVKSNSSLERHLINYVSYKRPTHIVVQRWLYTDSGRYCLDEKSSSSKFSLVPPSHLSRDEYRLIVENSREAIIETNDYIGEKISTNYFKQYTIPFTHNQKIYTIKCYINQKYTLCMYEGDTSMFKIITREKFTPDFEALFT